MSDDSNDPNPNITIEEFFKPRIVVNEATGKIHLFFGGKTPRAQLSIDLNCAKLAPEMVRGLIVTKFPQCKLSLIAVKRK